MRGYTPSGSLPRPRGTAIELLHLDATHQPLAGTDLAILGQMMKVLAVAILSFVSGSLPFSVWLGRLILDRDVRQYGDGNPGMTNVLRAGGRVLAIFVLLLDVSKGALPVAWAYHTLGFRGTSMFLTAVLPIVGHAFSPFLCLRGGKALAVTLGVWIGLTLWPVPLAAVLGIVLWHALVVPAGWAVILTLAGMLATILVSSGDRLLVSVLVANALVLAWTHRVDLCQRPRLRSSLIHALRRGDN